MITPRVRPTAALALICRSRLVMTAPRFNTPVNASRLASSLSIGLAHEILVALNQLLEQPALVDHCGDHFGDLAEDCLVDLSICALFAAREKKHTERAAGDEEGTGEARSAALSDDTAGGVRLRLGVEIGFQIVQDTGLAGLEYLLEAASFHRLRIALSNMQWSEVGPRPIGC